MHTYRMVAVRAIPTGETARAYRESRRTVFTIQSEEDLRPLMEAWLRAIRDTPGSAEMYECHITRREVLKG